MSGHSKWHNIQKTKGAADAKRSAAFTKIAKEIIVAVKEGGGSGDPNNNSRLATVIAKAKAVNMPNDNIKRTIDRALGSGSTDNYEAVTYEGYGPGGVAVIVEALTDNRQRTAPEVRHAFDKCNGNLGAQGCVSWSFDKKGVIVIDNEEGELDEDTVMMDALEAGAADFEADGPALEITCDPDAFNDVVKALEGKGYAFASAEIEMVPQNYITLTGEGDVKNMEKLIDMLDSGFEHGRSLLHDSSSRMASGGTETVRRSLSGTACQLSLSSSIRSRGASGAAPSGRSSTMVENTSSTTFTAVQEKAFSAPGPAS